MLREITHIFGTIAFLVSSVVAEFKGPYNVPVFSLPVDSIANQPKITLLAILNHRRKGVQMWISRIGSEGRVAVGEKKSWKALADLWRTFPTFHLGTKCFLTKWVIMQRRPRREEKQKRRIITKKLAD